MEDKKEITLVIKNMVCNRCIKVVKEELEKLGLVIKSIRLGEVIIENAPGYFPCNEIKAVLEENGFELLEDRKAKIIEQIKIEIIKLIHSEEVLPEINLSHYISNKLTLEYHYLSSLFSQVENITIEQYFILQKVERVKELLKYGELTLSEIAFKLGYSSVQHLSNQFKKITGMTASRFKTISGDLRKPLDFVGI
jgi:YesN/AraC family two-component response regulator